MAVPNLPPRLFLLSSKTFSGKSNLIFNNYRFLHRNNILHHLTTRKFGMHSINRIQLSNKRFCSNMAIQDGIKTEKHDHNSLSSFQQQMHVRKKQAQHSILIELSNRNDISSATSTCEQYGEVKNIFSYNGESENIFLLLEFTNKESVEKLLTDCKCQNILDCFTTFSRIIRFDKKFNKNMPKTTLTAEQDTLKLSKTKRKTVSELIEDIYVSEKLSELDTRLRFFFCEFLKDSLRGLFPHCEAVPFGSSVNGLGRHGCDLDIVIRLYPVQVTQNSEFYFLNKTCVGNVTDLQRRSVYALGAFFSTFLPGLNSVQKILHARVPIIKFNHKIIKMDCDISVNNMPAVLMSEIIYFCGEIDPRVRPLLYAVKKWAKDASITYESPGAWITNFGLSLLVIFFLQNRPVPILPNLNEALQIVGEEFATHFAVEYLTSVSTLQAKASVNEESLATLLKEFLSFLGSHPFKDKHFSVLSGQATLKRTNFPIWMQYPVEEDKNVTKNVSHSELFELCEKARLSSKFLASNIQIQSVVSTDLSFILGIPNIKKLFSQRNELDMNKLLNDKTTRNNQRRIYRKSV
ncbi:poly(A) RNA polymerase, mitochondrial [Trichonephila clavata]|uniref:Poly(A) RNA polymerase, mitochondrial n=1 Tax=Trichonephila clavata TaxID=2740835 RepID=A0A8X6IV29_TRICU|nr:poly(A) RNA polymerase, mitochondrial [Trichonephila clavata]